MAKIHRSPILHRRIAVYISAIEAWRQRYGMRHRMACAIPLLIGHTTGRVLSCKTMISIETIAAVTPTAVITLLLFIPTLGCSKKPTTPDDELAHATPIDPDAWFVDRTESSGINFVHQRGPERHWLPEIMSGGAAWIDFDDDGLIDLYLVQGGDLGAGDLASNPTNRMYRNKGDGSFEDVTKSTGVGDRHYGMGAAVGDFDADGDLDLYVTNVGPNVLYRNNGDGSFSDVTDESNVGHGGWGTAASFVDYDADGHLDLLLVNYLRWSPERELECKTGDSRRDYCSPLALRAPAMDTLYRNQGDGTFQDVTHDVGLSAAYGNGLGAVVADFNRDARMDFYVANDGMPNQLWLQQADGRFRDDALQMGCSVNRTGAAEAGMGVAVVDIENDGDLDLFMTHLGKETNTLYVNEGPYFADATAASKLAGPSVNFTGFGLGFADFNNDSRLDLYVANGRVGRNYQPLVNNDIFAEPNQLFAGTGTGSFSEVVPQGGVSPQLIENSRAAAFADYDNDGDVDIAIVNNGGRMRLLNNRRDGHNSFRMRVLDEKGRDAIGALVGVRTESNRQWRCVNVSYSYLASNEPHVHFGVGNSKTIEEVMVHWPSGRRETFGPFEVGSNQVIQARDDKTR